MPMLKPMICPVLVLPLDSSIATGGGDVESMLVSAMVADRLGVEEGSDE